MVDASRVGRSDARRVRHGLCQQLFAQAGWDRDGLHHCLDALIGHATSFPFNPAGRALLNVFARGEQVGIKRLFRQRIEPRYVEPFESGFTVQRIGLGRSHGNWWASG